LWDAGVSGRQVFKKKAFENRNIALYLFTARKSEVFICEDPAPDFLDVGWGGDVKTQRKYLPDTFFNLRLNPLA